MKTDRELLELAAKAAGDEIQWDLLEHVWYRETEDYPGNPEWNPLTDDGDAFWLAVQLGILDSHMNRTLQRLIAEEQQRHGRLTAVRRAIVRAAAEIGKGMK